MYCVLPMFVPPCTNCKRPLNSGDAIRSWTTVFSLATCVLLGSNVVSPFSVNHLQRDNHDWNGRAHVRLRRIGAHHGVFDGLTKVICEAAVPLDQRPTRHECPMRGLLSRQR